MQDHIYKVTPRDLWEQSVESGSFLGAPIDEQDGFIHFSTRDQVQETVRLHFHGQDDLLLVEVPTAPLGGALVWEASRGGALFPHLYGSFDTSLASQVLPLTMRTDGTHEFPEF